jgi:hypothetical protein
VLVRLAALALPVALLPAAAAAQFAGVVVAPTRAADPLLATPAQLAAERDSIRTEALSDMRAWVDSAAGVVTVTPRPPGPPREIPAEPATPGTPAPAAPTPAPPARPPQR